MIDSLKRFGIIIIATLGIWFGVAMVDVITGNSGARDAAAILAFLSTMAIWIVLGLDQIGKVPATTDQEKTKRDSGSNEDARVALLMSLLTPDERDALKSRLADELSGDGEAVTLADLLEDQESARHHTH